MGEVELGGMVRRTLSDALAGEGERPDLRWPHVTRSVTQDPIMSESEAETAAGRPDLGH